MRMMDCILNRLAVGSEAMLIFKCLLLAILVGTASAHSGLENQTEVRLHRDRLELVVRASFSLAWRLMGSHAPGESNEAARAIAKPLLIQEADRLFDVSASGERLPVLSRDCVFELDEHVAFVLTYPRPEKWPLVFNARFLDRLGWMDSGTIAYFDQTDAPFRRDIEASARKILMKNDASFVIHPETPTTSLQAPAPAVTARVTEPRGMGMARKISLGGLSISFFLCLVWLVRRALNQGPN